MNPINPARLTFAILAAASLLLGACGGNTILTPGEERISSFETARSKWKSGNYGNYSFEFRWTCYCARNVEWVIVTVRENRIIDVEEMESGRVPGEEWEWSQDDYRTIDGLFEMIEETYDRPAGEVRASYEETSGFPIDVMLDYRQDMEDEEVGFEIRKVTIEED